MQHPSWKTGVLLGLCVSIVNAEASRNRGGFASRIEDELGLSAAPTVSGPRNPPSPTDWAQPPAACIEELVPKLLPCLDLSKVGNPLSDFPAELSDAEKSYWTIEHRADLNLCRAREVRRREIANPGNQSSAALAWAWMWEKSVENQDAKIDAIYRSAARAEMPPQVLYGALRQESLLASLGISPDGGNYSCGIAQINVTEWCRSMDALSIEERRKLGWPDGLACTETNLPSSIVEPFYRIAMRKLGDRPDYELTASHFENISFAEIGPSLPPGSPELQHARFAAVMSFARHCFDARRGIEAKGHELRSLFIGSVPKGARISQLYPEGETFRTQCREAYATKAYPFHTGWLLADAIYNAGSRQVAVVQHYYAMTPESHESGEAWRPLLPTDLIEALHWGGKWSSHSGKIEYQNAYGTNYAQGWFKSCVVQRHVARVVQYAVRPGHEIARSLDTEGCSPTKVPEYRKRSSGRKTPR